MEKLSTNGWETLTCPPKSYQPNYNQVKNHRIYDVSFDMIPQAEKKKVSAMLLLT